MSQSPPPAVGPKKLPPAGATAATKSPSPAGKTGAPPAQANKSPTPAQANKSPAPAQANKSPAPAQANKSPAPAQANKSPAPAAANKSPAKAAATPPAQANKSPSKSAGQATPPAAKAPVPAGKAPTPAGKAASPAPQAGKAAGTPQPATAAPPAQGAKSPTPPGSKSATPQRAATPTGAAAPAGATAPKAALPPKAPTKTPPAAGAKSPASEPQKTSPADGGRAQSPKGPPGKKGAGAAAATTPSATGTPPAPATTGPAKKSPARVGGKKAPPPAGTAAPAAATATSPPAEQPAAAQSQPQAAAPQHLAAPPQQLPPEPQDELPPQPQQQQQPQQLPSPQASTPAAQEQLQAPIRTPPQAPAQSGTAAPQLMSGTATPPPAGTPQAQQGQQQQQPPLQPQQSQLQQVRRASPRRATHVQRVQQGPLDTDPRSGLPLIDFPRDRQNAFAHVGSDILLHIFLDADRISSKGKPLRRVVFITDQTIFVCEDNGGILRCVQVSKINQVNVAADNSNEIALVIPSEYDVILRFDRKQQRDDVLVILRAVYKRMVDGDLNVQQVKEIRPNQYRMEKPPGFQLQRIPQRTRANLAKTLESIDVQDRERQHAIRRVQEQLEYEHRQEHANKQQELAVVAAKLAEANVRQKQQQDELDKLRQAYAKCQRRVEEIDAQFSVTGEAPANKDYKIRELQEVVEALSASVSKANEERVRAEALRRAGDFEEKDLDFVETDVPRIRGRSLHHQGLIEVLQRQHMEKQRELAELTTKQLDIQKMTIELRKKEDILKELEQNVTGLRSNDPSVIYSSAAQAPLEELLRGNTSATSFASPSSPGGGGAGSPGSSSFYGASSPDASSSRYVDPTTTGIRVDRRDLQREEDGDVRHVGVLPQARVTVTTDIPDYYVPPDEKDFKVDPRTKLRFVDVPQLFAEKFRALQGSIMFFFAVGSKANKRGRDQKRIIVVSDQSLYQCNTSGNINRCIWITSIRQIEVDVDNHIALRVDGRNEYDLLIQFDNNQVCEDLISVLKVCSEFAKRNPPMQIKTVEHVHPSEYALEKPPSWEFQLHPARSKRLLYRALQQLGKTSAEERARASAAYDQHTQDIINRIREELRGDINARREREFVHLHQQLQTMKANLQERQLDIRNLRRKISDHKCNIGQLRVNQQSLESYESQGMYWIPTDPVVMECESEVLHIQFHDNFVVTSHPNGFLNVWDIGSADLAKTLKVNGHTARVQAFHFDGHNLLSGGFDSTIRHWNIMQPSPIKVLYNAHRGAITCIQFDSVHVVSGGTDGVLHVWEPFSMRSIKSLKAHKAGIVSFKLERNVLASAEWGWILVWDVEKGIVTKALRDDNGGINSIDLSGTRLLSGGCGGILTVWNLHTGDSEVLEGHTDDIHAVQLQQHYAVSSSADGTIRMWNVKEHLQLGIFHNSTPHEVKSFHFRANRFVVGEETSIKCWTR